MKYAHLLVAGYLVGPLLPPGFLIPQGNHRTGPDSPRQTFPIEPVSLHRQTGFRQTARAAMSPDSARERILELSAEAQIKRREAGDAALLNS